LYTPEGKSALKKRCDTVVAFRLTADEHQQLLQIAEEETRSLSSLLRHRLLSIVLREAPAKHANEQQLRPQLNEVR
jgi:hypothetical protein